MAWWPMRQNKGETLTNYLIQLISGSRGGEMPPTVSCYLALNCHDSDSNAPSHGTGIITSTTVSVRSSPLLYTSLVWCQAKQLPASGPTLNEPQLFVLGTGHFDSKNHIIPWQCFVRVGRFRWSRIKRGKTLGIIGVISWFQVEPNTTPNVRARLLSHYVCVHANDDDDDQNWDETGFDLFFVSVCDFSIVEGRAKENDDDGRQALTA